LFLRRELRVIEGEKSVSYKLDEKNAEVALVALSLWRALHGERAASIS